MQSQYAWVLEAPGQPTAVFTWPNCVKKYIRDAYTVNGNLVLPPPGYLSLKRYKVNPRVSHAVINVLIDIEEFLNA